MTSAAYCRLFFVTASLAFIAPASSIASHHSIALQATLTATLVSQATAGTDAERRQEAKDLLGRARTAIKENNFALAESLISRAEQLNVTYDRVLARFQDTPEKLRKELTAARGKGEKSSMPSDRFAPPPSLLNEPTANGPTRPAAATNPPPSPLGSQFDPAAKLTNDFRPANSGPDANSPLLMKSPDTNLTSPDRLPRLDTPSDLNPQRPVDATRFPTTGTPNLPSGFPIAKSPNDAFESRPADRAPASLSISDNKEYLRSRMDNDSQLGNPANDRYATERNSPPPVPSPRTGPGPAVVPGKSEANRLVAQARAAMDRGDLDIAKQFLTDAIKLNVPDSAYVSGETRPYLLMLELERLMDRRQSNSANNNYPVAQASAKSNDSRFPVAKAGGNNDGGRFPVAQSVYDPVRDNSRTVAARAEETGTAGSSNSPTPASPAGPSLLGAGKGISLYQQGLRALEKQDRATALKLFKEAWNYQNEFDANTRSQLRDKLNILQQAGAEPIAAGREPSPLEAVNATQQMAFNKLQHEIFVEQEQAERMKATDPRGSLDRMTKLRDRIMKEQLEPAARTRLLTMVDRNINNLKKFIEENRSEIDNSERTAKILGDIERERRTKDEIQQKIAELYEQFNSLVDDRRYAEAEMVARQANELQPENEVAQALVWKSKFLRRVAEMKSIDERKEEGFYKGLANVDEASAGFDDNEPIVFGDTRKWSDMSNRRRRWLDKQRKRMSPAEVKIQQTLAQQVEVRFNNRPLKEVIDVLAAATGVNFHLDPQGLAVEGVTSDTPISIDLRQPISLRSALNLILEPMRLGYVIQNEVLKITSEQTRESDVYPQVYDVADLVIPIPNFVPGYNTGLPSAIAEAHRSLGYGNSLPNMGNMPLTLASSQAAPANASVLAQMGAGGLLGGNRMQQQMGAGPGGLGGGGNADFDTLIDLITSSVSPKTWAEVGGSGSIEAMPSNLSIVVSQTQEVHDQIADLLEQLRRLQDLQVTIEVRFITLSDNFFERIGIDFDFNIDDNSRLNESTNTPNALPDDIGRAVTIGLGSSGTPSSDLDIPFRQNSFGLAQPTFGGFTADAGLQMGMAILSDIEVFFLLNAAAGDQRTNVLQAPKVTLFNGQQASVFDTAQRPFVIGIIPVVGDFAAAHQPVIVVLNEGTSMNVQAVVSSDRRFVRLTLVPFFSQIGKVDTFTFNGKTTTNSGTIKVDPTDDNSTVVDGKQTITEGTTVQLPTFQFTTVTTTVSVPDGGTVLLGGIKRLKEQRIERGVPMLNKIPYVNRLFKNVGISREAQSLMMMVTPRIIIQEEEEEKLGLAPGNP